jgi:glycosyltransferase involved in cell wall biosynthesis
LNYLFKYSGVRQRIKTGAMKKRIERAEALVFPCEFTRAIVRKHFAIQGKRTAIIPYGNCLAPGAEAEPQQGPPTQKFLFSIGALLAKKNFHVLVPMLQRIPEYSLVIAGDASTAYAEKILDDAAYYGVSERLLLTGPISDEEKVWWYKHCEAFVFPSLSEGFGLPVVEAMSLGKPVFISNLTSLPEVGGVEAYYWETFDPDIMAEKFKEGMREYQGDAAKAQRIRQWAGRFSWESCGKLYMELYKEICG